MDLITPLILAPIALWILFAACTGDGDGWGDADGCGGGDGGGD